MIQQELTHTAPAVTHPTGVLRTMQGYLLKSYESRGGIRY